MSLLKGDPHLEILRGAQSLSRLALRPRYANRDVPTVMVATTDARPPFRHVSSAAAAAGSAARRAPLVASAAPAAGSAARRAPVVGVRLPPLPRVRSGI